MNKTAIGVVIGIVLVIGGVFLLSKSPTAPVLESAPADANAPIATSTTSTAPSSTPTPVPAQKAGEYTLVDVSKHGNSSSCWSVVNGGVYDLTSWIGKHPGGDEAILKICGKDGSAAFNDQHGGMQKQANLLATFKIGVLVK